MQVVEDLLQPLAVARHVRAFQHREVAGVPDHLDPSADAMSTDSSRTSAMLNSASSSCIFPDSTLLVPSIEFNISAQELQHIDDENMNWLLDL
jgi:hypothetical protein